MIGLFGVDFILDGQGVPWPVEVNPRYTASVEVIEMATGDSLLARHVDACRGRPVAPLGSPGVFAAKEIVFAEKGGVFNLPAEVGRGTSNDPLGQPEVADVPEKGTAFRAGDPVLTVFARGPSMESCRKRLGAARRGWLRRIAATGG
jgi:predicted ATP-grasp superfamily ATP-dependent carboligase